MNYITKTSALSRFANNKCKCYYKNQKEPIEYTSPKHINWKNLNKITFIFESTKTLYRSEYGDVITRDGTSFLFKE